MILLYKLVLHLAVLSGTVVFVTSFKSYQWIGYVLALPFYYAFLGTVQLFLN